MNNGWSRLNGPPGRNRDEQEASTGASNNSNASKPQPGRRREVDLAELMRAARLRWETDPEGMERERREWVTDTEARLAAGEVLPAQTVELLEAHRRRERSRQMEAAR